MFPLDKDAILEEVDCVRRTLLDPEEPHRGWWKDGRGGTVYESQRGVMNRILNRFESRNPNRIGMAPRCFFVTILIKTGHHFHQRLLHPWDQTQSISL